VNEELSLAFYQKGVFMRFFVLMVLLALLWTPLSAQDSNSGAVNEKAQKSFNEGLKHLKEGREDWALDEFKKADKQAGGQCLPCQQKMVKYGVAMHDWKTAELASEEMTAQAKGQQDMAIAHYQFAVVLFEEGTQKHKGEYFSRSHDEIAKALASYANFPDAILLDGKALSNLDQDDAAKTRYEQFLKMKPTDGPEQQRVARYIARPELARARLAPPFSVTTLDGTRISMDDLQGKVVLLDFWATWCGPCREALPHIREVARKFQGQPLVILSVSLDNDQQKWKDFVAKNEMTWPQYFDGGFAGSIAKMFSVSAIPHTFTIDADGVLQDEHIGDTSIEGKIKKLIAQARELHPAEAPGK
jgi:thiol-disulfide isomerase/thioredoxin